ncbi:MAG: hypothetical protein Q8P24_18660 [Desulfobacterales bacterium]|nr:hypothetical protein [Desulfobacterales bacterium]
MKRYLTISALLIMTFTAGVISGMVIQKYEIFPDRVLKTAFNNPEQEGPYGPWSIGIYEGSTPFDLAAPEDVSNPVLTGKDVADRDAAFIADPFMVVKNGKYFMFFEVLDRKSDQGVIAYADSADGREWHYRKVVINEKFHLSYPYVFEWDNSYYLIPESNEDFSVRLYKATQFPEKWEYAGNLLSGYQYLDPSIFRHEDKWWMFVAAGNHETLNLYFSDNLLSGWKPHPKNPIVKRNKHFSRPAGRVIVYDGKLFRLAQDDDPSYGIQVFAFEISELSETSYAEKLASTKPIVTKTAIGWNAAGMHHVDLHKIGNKWVSAVDGRSK